MPWWVTALPSGLHEEGGLASWLLPHLLPHLPPRNAVVDPEAGPCVSGQVLPACRRCLRHLPPVTVGLRGSPPPAARAQGLQRQGRPSLHPAWPPQHWAQTKTQLLAKALSEFHKTPLGKQPQYNLEMNTGFWRTRLFQASFYFSERMWSLSLFLCFSYCSFCTVCIDFFLSFHLKIFIIVINTILCKNCV